MTDPKNLEEAQRAEFVRCSEQTDDSLVREFVDFLVHNRKWWLLPIMAAMGLLSALMLLGSSPVAPFIYTLF